jgi:hypothetical protein
MKRDSKSTNERGPFLRFVGACCALASLIGTVQTVFFSSYNISVDFSPIAQQAGHAAVLGRLSHSVCVSGLESEMKAKTMKLNKRDVDIKHLYINQLKGLVAEGFTRYTTGDPPRHHPFS